MLPQEPAATGTNGRNGALPPGLPWPALPEMTAAQDPAGKLAKMIIETPYESIPARIVDLAKQAIFDTLAVTIAGSSGQVSPQIVEQVTEWGGAPQSPILVYGTKVPAPAAAFANGVMARCIDMGDVHESAGHLTEWNVPTMLAALGITEKKVSGREFIAAYLAGCELGVRTCVATKFMIHTNDGIIGEFQGSLIAAASVSRILGLTVDETWNALGICYSVHSLSEMQKYPEGTQMARVQHGFAGETAIKAVALTRRGVTAPKGIYMGYPGGVLRRIPWSGVDPDKLTDGLGKKWLYADGLSMKPYSGCKFTHSFVAATVDVMAEQKINHRDIAAITCVGSLAAKLCTVPAEHKWNPQSTAECLFSAPYMIATAVLRGDVFITDFEEKERFRPDKRELMQKITITHDPAIKDEFEGYSVEISLNDGRRFRHVTPYVKGHPHNRMTWDDLTSKFWKCTSYAAVPLPEAKLQRLIELCKSLEDLPDMREVVAAMTP
jgi:2-methylcitrate dehydratase PrpD